MTSLSFHQKAQKRANELFDKNLQMILEQFEWLDIPIDELIHSRLTWMAKLSAVHSVELQLELCDHMSQTYWNAVIREIFEITKPFKTTNPNEN